MIGKSNFIQCCSGHHGLVIMFLLAVVATTTESFRASITFPTGFLSQQRQQQKKKKQCSITIVAASRYGPVENFDFEDENDDSESTVAEEKEKLLQEEFQNLLDRVAQVKDPNHIPSLLTKNMDLILNLSNDKGVKVIESILENTTREQGKEAADRTSQVIELVISFAEDFVQQVASMEDNNKQLLGKIIKTISEKENVSTAERREQALDELLAREKEHFTPGFLRHIEGECERIANAPKMTTESVRLLELLRVIQTRVLEELASSNPDWGEAAQVLGQLTGYDDVDERMAVLEAGLTVRGFGFARELKALTEEALEGFAKVHTVDPELVKIIEQVDERIEEYIMEQQEEIGFQ